MTDGRAQGGRRRVAAVALAVGLVVSTGPGRAREAGEPPWDDAAADMSPEQQEMMAAFQASMTPGAPHEWLASLTGEYLATVRSWETPGGEPAVSEAEVVRTMELGGRVLREAWSGSVMGMPFTGLGRTGYDNVTDRYWSTWTDNLSTGLFVAHGQRHEDGTLEFRGEMPDPRSGKMIPTRSVATHGPEFERMDMYQTMDGKEIRIMAFELRAATR